MSPLEKFELVLKTVKEIYPSEEVIPLHRPLLGSLEKDYLNQCIDDQFVSSVGPFVTEFEEKISEFTGAPYSIAIVNGTSALHLALHAIGVTAGTEVITQSLTFVGTANSICHAGGTPIFLDSDETHLGLSPQALESFLNEFGERTPEGETRNKKSGKVIKACLPVHVFGFPAPITEIVEICNHFGIPVVEDAAEGLGSFRKNQHVGFEGKVGAFSFNGNKVITTGGGGMLVTRDPDLGQKLKHLSTTAKQAHPWKFIHDQVAFNFRLPNVNAGIGCAQMKRLTGYLEDKRKIHSIYQARLGKTFKVLGEATDSRANLWLNAIQVNSAEEREELLGYLHENKVFARPIWDLMSDLPMFSHCQTDGLEVAQRLQKTIVNLPSSVRSL